LRIEIKAAIIGGIFAVIAAIVVVVIPHFLPKPPQKEETGKISVQDSRNVIIGDINTRGGDVIVDGNKVVNYFASHDYQQLIKKIKELEEDLQVIPGSEVQIRLQKSKKLEELKEQEQVFKQDILRLAETFSKIEINTDRLRQAKAYFEQGKFKKADEMLKVNEMLQDQERLLEARRQKEREKEELNKQLKNNANEFLIKAQTTGLDFNNPTRFEDACHYYEQSINSYPLFENHFGYAYFLRSK
jgi:tetratricopeptide (TPR) repeat protein